jgi:cytochrome oxidase assembly protein ShyY1
MKKWINWLILVVVFSVACGFLANWQFSRREAKLASIALVKQNYAEPSVPMEQLAPNGDFDVPSQNWRSVTLKGHYIATKTILVRNRPNDGQAGFEELVPFASAELGIVYISRGWLPSGNEQDLPDIVPQAELGELQIEAKVMSAEPILNRGAPAGQIASINIELAESKTHLSTSFRKSYLRMVSEFPSAKASIKPMPKPTTEEGNNLSYAVQWILFALMAIFALAWRIRKDRELELGVVRVAKRVKKSQLDEQFEDSITTKK